MSDLADLHRTRDSFEEGHRHLAVFATQLMKQIDVEFDPIQCSVFIKNRSRLRSYEKWLAGNESDPCPLDVASAGSDHLAKKLYSTHTRFVRSLRRIEADGDAFPFHLAYNGFPERIQPIVAEETFPWSILGHPFPCLITEPGAVESAVYTTFCVQYPRRRKAEWLFEKLPRLREQIADWRAWFAIVEGRLQGSIPNLGLALTDLQKRIIKALTGRALSAVGLAKAVKKDKSLLYRRGGLPELRAAKLVKNDRKIGGYYRPDAPPVD